MNEKKTIAFKELVERGFSADSFATGHPPYDEFLEAALQWDGSFPELEEATDGDPVAIANEVSLLSEFRHADPESLGLSMLINAYLIPNSELVWDHWRPPQLIRGFQHFLYDFALTLPDARIDAKNACALLNELPDALHRDYLRTFEHVFFNSFPGDVPSELRLALEAFLVKFLENVVLISSELPNLIARHKRLWVHIGRDPMDLDFYQLRQQMIEKSQQQTRRLVSQLGSTYKDIAKSAYPGLNILPPSTRKQFQEQVAKASKSKRGEMIADACRTKLASGVDPRWLYAVEDIQPLNLGLMHEDLIAPLQMQMELSEEQACTVLRFITRDGDRYASNYPTFGYNLAVTLANSLPQRRADLELLVKLTDHQTDQIVKDIVINALRGKRHSPVERFLRRILPRFFKEEEEPEMWAEWITDKRTELLALAKERSGFGIVDPNATLKSDWRAVRGQVYDLDVVGYAKRIALAQSHSADVSHWIADLHELLQSIGIDYKYLEQNIGAEEIASDGPRKDSGLPSIYGIYGEPTLQQLLACEKRTLRTLEKLIARIELCEDNPGLSQFEQGVSDQTRMRYAQGVFFNRVLFEHGLSQATGDGVHAALLERLDGFDFELLGGPYIEDTEPVFTDYEFEAWRSCIHALSALPPEIANPSLEAAAEKIFGPEIDPNSNNFAYAPQGYRQEELADAVIRALDSMPGDSSLVTIKLLAERARPEGLRRRLEEAEGLASYRAQQENPLSE